MRRLGRYFLWTLASLGFLLVAGIAAGTYVGLTYSPEPPEIKDGTVLWLDFTKPLHEKRVPTHFFRTGSGRPVLLDHVKAVRDAGQDPRIAGIVAEIGNGGIGAGHAQELRTAIAEFRKSGKFTVAYAEDFGSFGGGTFSYYLASAFEEIWLQPSGGVGLTGIAIESPFFAEAFDKLDVTPQFEQRHEFKGGAEPFTKEGMSLPVRTSLEQVVNGWMTQIVDGVENDRPPLKGRLRTLIDNGPYLAQDARTYGLVDRLAYWDELESSLVKRTGSARKQDLRSMGPAGYLSARAPDAELPDIVNGESADRPTVALVYGVGPIYPDRNEQPAWDDVSFSPYRVADALAQAREDDDIDAVLLRIDSPGGAYPQADMVWREVKLLRESGKPVVAVMADMAASGGYFVAMGADYIVAQPGTLTGSIGVYAGKFATEDLWARLGVNWETVRAGKHAGMWSMISEFSPSELEKFRAFLDFVYADFTKKAAIDRQLNSTQIDRAARGRIWTGASAVDVGLVDELGGMQEAEAALKRLLNRTPSVTLDYTELPRPLTPWEQLERLLNGQDDPLKWVATRSVEGALKEKAEAVLGDIEMLRSHIGLTQLPPLRISD